MLDTSVPLLFLLCFAKKVNTGGYYIMMKRLQNMEKENINTYLMAPLNNNRRAVVILNKGVNQKKIRSIS